LDLVGDLAGKPTSRDESPKPDPEARANPIVLAHAMHRRPEHGATSHDPRPERSRRRPADATGPIDRESEAAEDCTSGDAGSDTPLYQSLFDAGTTPRKPRRERTPATAMQRALGLLTRREHSRKELTRKLVTRGVDPAEVEAAVGKLTDGGWQDDRRFAEALVRSRASNGYGPLHIRAELATHDLPAELRQAALDDFEGDWLEIAREAVGRRFERIDDLRLRERKAADYLIRRGFPGDIVRAATRFRSGD
jgi:regulatory protein